MGIFGKKKTEMETVEEVWTIDDEITALEENLKTLPIGDPIRDKTMDELQKLYQIKKTKNEGSKVDSEITKNKHETASNWAKVAGGVVGTVGGLWLTAKMGNKAYKIDESDDIVQNKNTMNIFNKIFPPRS